MSVTVICPRCKKSQNVADTLAGTETRCASCGEPLRVPLADEAGDAGSTRRKSGKGTPLWANVAAGVCAVLLVAAVVWILVHAFGSSVTLENYQKLKVGMTEAEVQAILGSPNKGKRSMTSAVPGREHAEYWIWMDGTKTITVIFVDGKVAELQSNLQPTTPQ
jgi:hypothetical protein